MIIIIGHKGFLASRMPGSIVDDDVELRSLRLSDGPYMRNGLGTLELYDPLKPGTLIHRPWISLWW